MIIVGIAAEGLKKDMLGMRIGLTFIDRMRSLNVSPVGENGEFQSLVLNCPLFQRKIRIEEFEISESGSGGAYRIKKASLT